MISIDFIDTEVLTSEMYGVKEWIRVFVKSYGKEVGELYYSFCSDEYLYNMNVELLGHDFYTEESERELEALVSDRSGFC